MNVLPDAAWLDRLRRGTSPRNGLRDGPVVDEDGRTPVPGVWIAGDLADTPVILGAAAHGDRVGRALVEALAASAPPQDGVDVIVLGAGPAGCAAALALQAAGRTVTLFERDRPFATLEAFPATKVLYAEPRGVVVPPPLRFEDAPKDAVVARLRAAVRDAGLAAVEGVEVTDVRGAEGAFEVSARRGGDARTLKARHIVIAVGRRGRPRRLEVAGEGLPHVVHALVDATAWAGEDVVVVGGGDSAAEAALQLADVGARVTLVHRGRLSRPVAATRDAVHAAHTADRLALRLGAEVAEITAEEVRLTDGTALPARHVAVLVGTDPPDALLRQLRVPLRSDPKPARTLAWLAFAAFVWCFYVLKTGRAYFPFHAGGPLADASTWLTVTLPWTDATGAPREVGAGFWGTVAYTLAIAVAGVFAWRRHTASARPADAAHQGRRYLSLVAFQVVVLFGVPELLAPLVTTSAHHLYGIGVPWPLRLESLALPPEHAVWMGVGGLVAFVAVPWMAVRHNERFCSWACGCGGLAETVGDLWRELAPRGDVARRAEGAGVLVFVLAGLVSALVIADTWRLVGYRVALDQPLTLAADTVTFDPVHGDTPGDIRVADATRVDGGVVLRLEKLERDGSWSARGWASHAVVDGVGVWPVARAEGEVFVAVPDGARTLTLRAASSALSKPASFARAWYGLAVDFALASVLGVALYPMLGNRVWCRFFCPLRAWMEMVAARFGRLAIVADDTCIACGKCTEQCQMGIDVQGFARDQLVLDNASSACIQCGVCVEVCPMGTLTLVDRLHPPEPVAHLTPRPQPRPPDRGPRWG